MKKNKVDIVFIIIIIALVGLALVSLISSVINSEIKSGDYKFGVTSKDKIVDKTYKNAFTKLDLNIEEGEIHIKESESEEIHLIIYGEEDKTTVTTKNNELTIKIKEHLCLGLCLDNNPKVEVFLPKSYSNKINIESYYGNVYIENFENASINITQDFGDIFVKNAKMLDIYSDYGNVEVTKANTATIKAMGGNIEISSVIDAKLYNDNGNIKIKNVTNYVDIYNDYGNIIINEAQINKDSTIKADLGNITIKKINEIYIIAETEDGIVNVNGDYNNSDITLTIKNNSGNITINN